MPTKWEVHISLRAGLLINEMIKETCTDLSLSLGTNYSLLNPGEEDRKYSTVFNNDAKGTIHCRSMLNSSQAWSAKTIDVN
jgi:hypothetical protein